MKILLFNNSEIIFSNNDHCVETRTGEFAKELESLGHKVVFYGQILDPLPNTADIYPLSANGLEVKGSKRFKSKLLTYFLLYLKAIPAIYKADFVYMFYPNSLRFLLFFLSIFNKKFGLYIRGIDDLKNKESHFFYKKATKVFTVADFFTDYVNQISPGKVASTIRPMIIFDEKDIFEGRTFHKDKKVFKILYLGRMTNDKGVIELLHAAKLLMDKQIKLELNLVGSGEYLEELKALPAELGINDVVHFHGPIFNKEKIRTYYQEADVFVLPTYHEGFPRTLYEAMICGTPIITTFVGGIAGLMKNTVNCLEIQPKSIESVAQNLAYAHENYEEMLTLAGNARTTIKEVFNTRKYNHAESLHESLKNLKL